MDLADVRCDVEAALDRDTERLVDPTLVHIRQATQRIVDAAQRAQASGSSGPEDMTDAG